MAIRFFLRKVCWGAKVLRFCQHLCVGRPNGGKSGKLSQKLFWLLVAVGIWMVDYTFIRYKSLMIDYNSFPLLMVETSASHQLICLRNIAFWIGGLRLSSDVFVQADVATDGWQGLGEGLSIFVIILKLKWNMILETAYSMQKTFLLVISIFFQNTNSVTALRARDDGCDQCGLTVGTMARSWVCNTPSKWKFGGGN